MIDSALGRFDKVNLFHHNYLLTCVCQDSFRIYCTLYFIKGNLLYFNKEIFQIIQRKESTHCGDSLVGMIFVLLDP